MNDRRNNSALIIATLAMIMSTITGTQPLRQKMAEVVSVQTSEIIESVDDSGGTVLPEDPMMDGGPIPIIPVPEPQDDDIPVPPGATDKPVLVDDLKIKIDGPADAMVGDMVKLHAVITGTPTAIKWVIDPPVDDFEPLDGGLRAVFANRNVGTYHVVCSIAGNNGHVDVDTHEFEIIPQPPEHALTAHTIGELTPQLTVEELVRRWLAEVRSPNKLGEAHAIAGSFRGIANTLRSGNVPGPDLLREVQRASEIAVGPQAFANWRGYFDRVREFLIPLNAARTVFTPEQYANTFDNIASVMETLTTMEQ